VFDWFEHHGNRAATRHCAMVVLIGVVFLSLGVFLTASRAGTGLLPVAWLAIYAATRPLWRVTLRQALRVAVAVALLAALGLYLLRGNAVMSGILARYDFTQEMRPQIWADALFVARTYFPVGVGMGAFIPAFIAGERLESVDATVPNRAHNDYLELAIEAGVIGFVVLAILAAIVARLAWRQLHDPSARTRRQAIFAVGALTIVALHSQVDYPLRSISLACIAAASAGLLVPVARGSARR